MVVSSHAQDFNYSVSMIFFGGVDGFEMHVSRTLHILGVPHTVLGFQYGFSIPHCLSSSAISEPLKPTQVVSPEHMSIYFGGLP